MTNAGTEEHKGLVEIDTLRAFIARSQLPIDPSSVEKRTPPEPDLLCRHSTEGAIAFELVNLCDPEIAKVLVAGPLAKANAFFTADPSTQIITNKLKKTYKTNHPIELLVYTDGRIVTPDDVIIPTIRLLFESIAGPYRRVWFMGEETTCIIWEAR